MIDEKFFMATLKDWNGNVKEVFKPFYTDEPVEMMKRVLEHASECGMTQSYAVASKLSEHHWSNIRKMIGDKRKYAECDAGSLKIGNESFSILIPNGEGDGTMRYAVYAEGEEFNDDMLNFFTSVEGEVIDIYGYDCGFSVAEKLPAGRYGIYQGYGFVVIKKWG